MAKRVRFAVLGLGMGRNHCRAITAVKGAELAAVCDHDETRLKAVCDEFDVHGTETWTDLIKDDGIDAVCVCTESGTHAKFARRFAEAGKHLIVEKPVDIRLPRITKLGETVDNSGVKCGVALQLRFNPCHAAIKQFIDKGKLGRIVSAHAALPWYRPQSYYEGDHGSWKGTWKLDGGGSLMNQGIHSVDLLQWFCGPVHEVCGYAGVFAHDIEAEDQAVALLKFEDGGLGTIFTATCVAPDQPQRIEVFGTDGSFRLTGGRLERFDAGAKGERERMLDRFSGKTTKDKAGVDPMAVGAEGHGALVDDLVKAIRNDRAPAITIADATHCVEIVTAIYKSNRTARSVKVASLRK